MHEHAIGGAREQAKLELALAGSAFMRGKGVMRLEGGLASTACSSRSGCRMTFATLLFGTDSEWPTQWGRWRRPIAWERSVPCSYPLTLLLRCALA